MHSQSNSLRNQNQSINIETATFGAGCFWCVEAIFQQIKGVKSVVSGYMGGHTPNPTYQAVCSGTTGHVEVVQLQYNTELISYTQLLEIFWKTHDPTTKNRQGNDIGTQYKSAIFYHNEQQKNTAESYKKLLDEADIWAEKIVTEIIPASDFYKAENYHQNYYDLNVNKNSYCSVVITPKLEKLHALFADHLKEKDSLSE